MAYFIEVLWGNTYEARLLWAVFTIMFALGLRVGEVSKSGSAVHTLRLKDVAWKMRAGVVIGMTIHMHSFKHATGQPDKLTLWRNKDDLLCP